MHRARQFYSGDWHNGLKSGYGIAQFRNGDVYEGDWRNNKMSGHGVYQWKNATKFIGNFREDELNGDGTCEWPSGRQVRRHRVVSRWRVSACTPAPAAHLSLTCLLACLID